MPTIQVPTEILDDAGAVVEKRTTPFHIAPPADPLACQTCGRRHEPDQPHDVQSLHYQYAFYAEHGRWPTWKDTVAHCADDVKTVWETELRGMGHWPEDAE